MKTCILYVSWLKERYAISLRVKNIRDSIYNWTIHVHEQTMRGVGKVTLEHQCDICWANARKHTVRSWKCKVRKGKTCTHRKRERTKLVDSGKQHAAAETLDKNVLRARART